MNDNEKDNLTGENHAGNHANEPIKILTATSMLGDKVFNRTGDHLGKIMDIMLNLSNGKVEYVVIQSGGFMGISQKYFAVPFNALVVDADRHAFILNQNKDAFKDHPGFDKNHWPETNSHPQYLRHYGGFMGPNTGSDH